MRPEKSQQLVGIEELPLVGNLVPLVKYGSWRSSQLDDFDIFRWLSQLLLSPLIVDFPHIFPIFSPCFPMISPFFMSSQPCLMTTGPTGCEHPKFRRPKSTKSTNW
jgi:hypothetical protein